ncbi:MAG: DUF6316 family protein [Pseudohongiellaceae bacterium]|nr:DUF6316 family protein [Pseudohongiellaceae bacterium]
MTSLRKDDRSPGSLPSRSERVFNETGLWYFRTREGQAMGPFRYESEARQMLDVFIKNIQAKEQQAAAAAVKPQFCLDPHAIRSEKDHYMAGATA